jgi:hypothetical protein
MNVAPSGVSPIMKVLPDDRPLVAYGTSTGALVVMTSPPR